MLFAFILKFKLKEKTIMRQSLIAVGMFLLTGGMVGCGTSSTQEKEDLIVVDVSKDYPKKELILQDLFDVEYIVGDDGRVRDARLVAGDWEGCDDHTKYVGRRW